MLIMKMFIMKSWQPMKLKFDNECFNIRTNQISDNHPIRIEFNEPMRTKFDNECSNITANEISV